MSQKSASTPPDGPNPGDSGPIGEISQEPSAFESFLDANQKKLIIVCILGILGLVAYVIYDGVRKMNKVEAAGVVSAANTVPEYDAAAEKYKDTNAGASALIFKAEQQWRDQQQQEAVATLEKVIADYPDYPVLASAKTALGSYFQQLGNLEKAKSVFQEAADLKGSTSSLALLSLGDIALQEEKFDEAKKIYNSVIADYGNSHPQVKTMAEQRLKLVGVAPPVIAEPKENPTPGAGAFPGISTNPIQVTPGAPSAPIQVTPVPAPMPPAATEPAESTAPATIKPEETSEPAEIAPPIETEETPTPVEESDEN